MMKAQLLSSQVVDFPSPNFF